MSRDRVATRNEKCCLLLLVQLLCYLAICTDYSVDVGEAGTRNDMCCLLLLVQLLCNLAICTDYSVDVVEAGTRNDVLLVDPSAASV